LKFSEEFRCRRNIATGAVTGLFELGETHWHETAFRTVVASLAEITRQSQRAA
jgi:hypothetical protein